MNKFGQTLVPETSMKEGKLLTLLDKLEEQLGHLPTCSKWRVIVVLNVLLTILWSRSRWVGSGSTVPTKIDAIETLT